VDADTGKSLSGWVVRESNYVYGLKTWFDEKELIPGSLINIQCGQNPGEVSIKSVKKRSNREWIRTALVGTDGGIVFATLKQKVTADYNERMVVAVPDVDAVDKLWLSEKSKPLDKSVMKVMRELSKLNSQGHVHAQEVYSAVNLIRRCPSGIILNMLFNSEWSFHYGDLYFRLQDLV